MNFTETTSIGQFAGAIMTPEQITEEILYGNHNFYRLVDMLKDYKMFCWVEGYQAALRDELKVEDLP